MKATVDLLAQRLTTELGAAVVTTAQSARASHAVDGVEPALVCSPESPAQVAALLRVCSEAEAAITPRGAGTAMPIGNRPRAVDVVVATSRLKRLIEHDDANLTVTVEAGMALTSVQETLARRNQFLPFDPPVPSRATVGGTVAANLNGPRRSFYGSVRDLVIGMKVVLGSGEQVKAGGKVVKNVAGYDMCKLFVGSLGTLGIITELTLRVAPIAETAATVIALGGLSQANQFLDDLAGSPLLPAAVTLANARAVDGDGEAWQVGVRCEGFEETVKRHAGDAQAMARRIGLDGEIAHDSAQAKLWQRIQDFPLQSDRMVIRVTAPRASVVECARTIEDWDRSESRPAIVSDTLAGILWVAEPPSPISPQRFADLLSLAQRCGGHAVMLSAPAQLKENIDVWGSALPTIKLMREIKNQFDPKGLLNPGRFVGGL